MKFECPPDHKHADKSTCYTKHGCRCVPCGERTRRYKAFTRSAARKGAVLRGAIVDPLGARRRLQALVAMGWGFDALGDMTGRVPQRLWKWAHGHSEVSAETDAFVRDLYSRLSMTPPPTETAMQRYTVRRATTAAERNGWVPPLAWDDIDRDPVPPVVAAGERIDFDHAKVEQAVNGASVPLTVAERRVAARRLVSTGRTRVEIAAQLGVSLSDIGWALRSKSKSEKEAA